MPFTLKKIAMRLRNGSEYIPLPGVRGEDGADGVSPTVTFTDITGGHTMTVTDKDHPSGQSINIMDGSGGGASMTILSYGISTWNDFITAYNSNSIVYCRASSAADPSSGSQTRLAFMAYVNDSTNPTNVEFQYYRSMSSHTDAQQGDQVFIYKLTSGGTWTVTVRETYTKIAAGTNMSSSYANGTLTLNATGGGGGTSDYDDLTDKPSINGTTLSGNKTAAELGLGTYSKPSGGIPQTDLASAVQTSLGLADSALQSVPSTYRTAAAQDAIDAAQDAQIEAISRPNLLDNWYFVGGGSQQGDGVFPINQRGQTSYSATGYKIDRWSLQRGSITLQNGGMLCTSPTDNTLRFEQRLPYGTIKDLLGKTCTISALVNDTLCVFTTTVSEAELTKSFVVDGVDCSLDLNFVAAWGTVSRPVQFFVGSGKSAVLKAVKFELGSYQTLAHNEGTDASPIWVLNEIPPYSEELNKCLMYFERLKGPYVGFATGYSTNVSNAYVCGKVNPKVKAPTITLSGTIYLQSVNHAGSDSSASTSLASVYALPSGNFSFICQSSNMTQGEFNQAQFRDTTSYLDFSAEQ